MGFHKDIKKGASSLKAQFQLGKAGITDTFISQLDTDYDTN